MYSRGNSLIKVLIKLNTDIQYNVEFLVKCTTHGYCHILKHPRNEKYVLIIIYLTLKHYYLKGLTLFNVVRSESSLTETIRYNRTLFYTSNFTLQRIPKRILKLGFSH